MGFIVPDGALLLLLVLILMFHYDLIHANALKMLLAVATTLVPIAMFTGHGSIRWPEGLVMSAGSVAGGFIGARLTMHERAKFWIYRILVAVLVLEIVHLGFQYVVPYIPPPARRCMEHITFDVTLLRPAILGVTAPGEHSSGRV